MGRLFRFLAVAVLAMMGAASAQQAPTRVALVIANAHYAGYPTLPNTEVDSGLVAASLRKAGFTTEVKNDLDGASMRSALAAFRTKAAGAQVALVYFAGHGMESGGRNWLLPIGVQLGSMDDLEFNAVESSLIVQATAGARARVIVLDACRNNPFAARMRGITRDATVGLAAPHDSVRGTLFMYSAAPGEEAQDGPPGQGSPFARAFARAIVTPGLDLRRAAGNISDAVYAETHEAQLPFQTSSLSGEEIIFVASVTVNISPVTVIAPDQRISALAAESAAFEVATKLWTAEGWQEFLRLHPDSSRAGLARQALASLQRPPSAPPTPNAAVVAPPDPLTAARRAVAAITPQEWNASLYSAIVSRAVTASSTAGLIQLANAGDAKAQFIVGYGYCWGIAGFSQNPAESVRLIKLSSAQAFAPGQDWLGVYTRQGYTNVTQDDRAGCGLFRAAADQGNANGQANLGACYANGWGGLTQNQPEATRLYRLAAALGEPQGQANLAIIYAYGIGVPVDLIEAARLRRLAAAQGNSQGQAGLAQMYEYGQGGLPQDRAEAIRLYRLAVAQGDQWAKSQLERLGETP